VADSKTCPPIGETCPPFGGTCPPTGGLKVFIFFHLTFNFFTVHVSLIYPALTGLNTSPHLATRGFTPCYLFRPVGAEEKDKGFQNLSASWRIQKLVRPLAELARLVAGLSPEGA